MKKYRELILKANEDSNKSTLLAKEKYEEEIKEIENKEMKIKIDIVANAICFLSKKHSLDLQDCIDLAFFCRNTSLKGINSSIIEELNEKLIQKSLILKNGSLCLTVFRNFDNDKFSLRNQDFIKDILMSGERINVDMSNIRNGEDWSVELSYSTENHEEDPCKIKCVLNKNATPMSFYDHKVDLENLVLIAIDRIRSF